MARLFISHSSADSDAAIALRAWLAGNGWDDVFLDVDPDRGIRAGVRWQEALRTAQARCEAVLLLISRAWLASDWCRTEYLLASQLGKRVIAVLIEPIPIDELPATLTAEWQVLDLTPSVDGFPADGLRRLRRGLAEAGIDATHFRWPPEGSPPRPPYPGLRALDEEDAGIFFGRDGQIIQALDSLRGLRDTSQSRLFAILAASGAGKSSFLRAGLLPRLRRDERFTVLSPLRPGRSALSGDTGLIAALAQAQPGLSRSAVAADLAQDPEALFKRIEGDHLVLPIDQAEECLDHDEGIRLLDLLAAAGGRLLPLLAVRSDRWEAVQSHPALQSMQQTLFSLPPMQPGTFGDVIRGPARRQSETGDRLEVEEPLVDRLLQDLAQGGARDSLPLLAFTLEGLWRDEGGTGRLTLERYLDRGGVRGAIEQSVARALRRAEDDRRIPVDPQARLALLRRGFIPWLAGIDAETGAPRRRVARLSEIPEEARPMMDILVEERLLTKDRDATTGETVLEPAHEALLRQWSLVGSWLGEDLQDFTAIEGIRRGARDWSANAEDPGWLAHAGARLAVAREAAKRPDFHSMLEPTDRAYLDACTATADARAQAEARRRRLRQGALTAALVATLGTSAVLWQFWSTAEAARLENAAALAVIAARDLQAEGKPEAALDAAREAFRMIDTEATRSALLSALMVLPDQLDRAVDLSRTMPTAIAWLPDGRILALASDGSGVIVGDGLAPASLAPAKPPIDGSAVRLLALLPTDSGALAIFRDGATVATNGWAVAGDSRILMGTEGALAIDRTGRMMAFMDGRGISFRDCRAGPCSEQSLATGDGTALALSADGALLAEAAFSGLRLHRLDTGTAPESLPGAMGAAFSEDGNALLTHAPEGGLRLISGLVSGPRNETLLALDNVMPDGRLALSPSGARLSYSCGAADLCTGAVGNPVGRLGAGAAPLAAAVWSRDGRQIASLDLAGMLRIWRADPPPALELGPVRDMSPAANGLVLRTSKGGATLEADGSLTPTAQIPPAPTAEAELAARFAGRELRNKATGLVTRFRKEDWSGVERLLDTTQGLVAWPVSGNRVAALHGVDVTLSEPFPARPTGVASRADRLYVATADGAIHRLELPDLATAGGANGLVPPAPPPALGATSLTISPDGTLFAASLGEAELAVRSTEDGSVRYVLPLDFPDAKAVAFAPSGLRLAILTSDGKLDLWDLGGAAPARQFSVSLAQDAARPTAIGWLDATTLAIVLPKGGVRLLPTEPSAWLARAERLLRTMRGAA